MSPPPAPSLLPRLCVDAHCSSLAPSSNPNPYPNPACRRPEDAYFQRERVITNDNRPADVEEIIQRVATYKLKNSNFLIAAAGAAAAKVRALKGSR
jgi:hypothetical protein